MMDELFELDGSVVPVRGRVKLFLFLFGTIPIALLSGANDLHYALLGEKADATVHWAARVDPPDKNSIDVSYSFTDPKIGVRREKDNIGASWDVPTESILIEYIPGVEGKSRVAGQLTFFRFFLILIGSVTAIILIVVAYSLYSQRRERKKRLQRKGLSHWV